MGTRRDWVAKRHANCAACATRIGRRGYPSVTIAMPFAALAIGVLTVRVRFPSSSMRNCVRCDAPPPSDSTRASRSPSAATSIGAPAVWAATGSSRRMLAPPAISRETLWLGEFVVKRYGPTTAIQQGACCPVPPGIPTAANAV